MNQHGRLRGALGRPLAKMLNILGILIRDTFRGFRNWSLINQLLAIAGFALILVCLFLVPLPSVEDFRNWSAHTGWWFPYAFALMYVVGTQFPIPRTVFTVSCGVLFGPAIGIPVALGSTLAGGVISFLIVRRLGRQWAQSRLTHPAIDAVNARLEARGWLAVGSLRMIGAVPFSILNYLCALSNIRLLPFAVATIVGSAPGTIATILLVDAATGHGSPWSLAISGVLLCIGVAGLILDRKYPVQTEPRRPTYTLKDKS